MEDNFLSFLLPDEATENYAYDIIGSRFPHPLSLYKHLPDLDSIPIAAFQEAAVQRLRILNFLHETFGAETSVSPSLLRKGIVGVSSSNSNSRGTGHSSAATVAATASAGADVSSAGVSGTGVGGGGSGGGGVGVSGGGDHHVHVNYQQQQHLEQQQQQQETGVRRLKKLLQEAGFMLPEKGEASLSNSHNNSISSISSNISISHSSSSSHKSSISGGGYWANNKIDIYKGDLRGGAGGEAGGGGGKPGSYMGACNSVNFTRAAAVAGGGGGGATTSFTTTTTTEQQRRREIALRDAVSHFALRLGNVLQENFRLLESRQTTLQTTVFQDPRVGELLTALPTAYVGKDFRSQTTEAAEDRLTPDMIKEVWRTSFPPCMRRLFGAYLREHHIKHSGRLQLWLFFKGAGLRMEENLSFNRSLWQDPQKFDREHAYTIRHIYGHEGKRADYPPLSCSKIISGSGMLQTPGVGDYHGCPFKHFDRPQLQKLLASFDLSASQIASVMKFYLAKDYQLACKEYFVQTHPGNEGDGVGNHPNHFYEASRRHHRKKLGAASKTLRDNNKSSYGSGADSNTSGRDSGHSIKSRSSESGVAFATANGHDVTMESPPVVSCGGRGRDGGDA